jgi:hypothetical protein
MQAEDVRVACLAEGDPRYKYEHCTALPFHAA